MEGLGFLLFLLFILVIVVISSIRIVPQAHAYVIERLGTYTEGEWYGMDSKSKRRFYDHSGRDSC